jgi:hypothetical protein
MVDYSSQKPIQNPSYFKKPATKSQLTAGGDGGKGAALAANVNGASGQANQSVPVESFLSGVSKKLGFVPNEPISTQDMNTGTSQSGILSGEGLLTMGANIANRAMGSPTVQPTGIPAGSLLAKQGTNQSTPVSITPSITTKPTISAATPTQSNITKTALGQFTTPTGGSASISISPNQPTNVQGMGLHQLTPDQQSYLQGQIDRNARPEVQAEFAKQAAIVDERRARTAAWDAANNPNSPENRATQSRNLFLGAMRNNNLAGIQEYGDLYKKEAGLAGDIAQNKLSAGSAASIEAQKLGQTAEIKGTEQSIEAQKHNDTVTQNYANWATNPSEGGMAHPATKLATAVQLGIKPDPALIFGGDKVNEFAQITDPAEKQSWLINELGPEGATQWINLHKSR